MMDNVTTANKDLTEAARRDMVLASIAIKYTQASGGGGAAG